MEKITLSEFSKIYEEDLFLLPEDKAIFIKAPTKIEATIEASEPNSEYSNSAHVESAPVVEAEEQEPIPIKGNFSNGILILHEEEVLTDEVMGMLVKMINAVGHSMSEIGLVSSISLEGRSMEDFQALNAHKVLKFGRVKHPINAVPAPEYQIYTDEETEYLFADSLTTISEDNSLKRKLWDNLQILFNIKSK